VLQIILEECDSPGNVIRATKNFPPGLEKLYLRCLKRKRKDRLLCNVNLLIWTCAAPESLSVGAFRELLAMDMETTVVPRNKMPAEELLLRAGVGLVTLDIVEQLVLPVHSTAREFVSSEAARLRFDLMMMKANSRESWPLCITTELWNKSTFRSALGSLCLSHIEQRTSREMAVRMESTRLRFPQPEIPRYLRRLLPSIGRPRAAEIPIDPSLFKRTAQQVPVRDFLQYAIKQWLLCNKTVAPDNVALPWLV
jgi:hypothetical protein